MATEEYLKELDADLQIDTGCVMIAEARHNFSCTDVTMAKAMLIYLHYQKVRNQHESNFHQESNFHEESNFNHLYATAAFCLSVQIYEEKPKMEDIIEFFEGLGTYTKDVSSMTIMKNKIQKVQHDIYRVIFAGSYKVAASKSKTFDTGSNTAHQYVLQYMHQFSSMPEIQQNIPAVKTLTLKYLNTFYLCQKCINYTSLVIAWAAMTIAFQHFHVDIGNYDDINKEMSACVKPTQNTNYQDAMDDMMMVADVGIRNLSVSD